MTKKKKIQEILIPRFYVFPKEPVMNSVGTKPGSETKKTKRKPKPTTKEWLLPFDQKGS